MYRTFKKGFHYYHYNYFAEDETRKILYLMKLKFIT